MIGGLVMTHGDDQGLVIPPRLAPIQVVIVPIARKEEEREQVVAKAREIAAALPAVRTHIDDRDNLTPGAKFYEWETKGVPFRIEVGPKDIAKQQLVLVRRLVGEGEERKLFLPETEVISTLPARLEEFQAWLLARANAREKPTRIAESRTTRSFAEIMDGSEGFVYTGWCGSAACEEKVKEETRATIRVLPDEEFRSPSAPRTCMVCGGASIGEVVWARAY
jgi:prolyl-tRNA synthetase